MHDASKHPLDPAHLAAFTDDALDDPECRRALRHLTTCPACLERLAKHAELSAALPAGTEATPSPNSEAPMPPLIADRATPPARPTEPWWWFLGAVPLRALFGAAMLLFILAAIILVQPFGAGLEGSRKALTTPPAGAAGQAFAAPTSAPTPPTAGSPYPGPASAPPQPAAVTPVATTSVPPASALASACETRPIRGFGLLYRSQPEIAARIGCPTGGERGLTLTIQGFEKGRVVHLDDRQPLALRDDGKWLGGINPENPAGLGKSLEPAAQVSGAIEDFQHGTLLWTEDRSITVLYADGTWEQYLDRFVETTATPANASQGMAPAAATATPAAPTPQTPAPPVGPAPETAPATAAAPSTVMPSPPATCPAQPVRGFGLVYNAHQEVADRLGCASGSEVGTAALQQSFERGVMIERRDIRQIFVIRTDGAWAAYPDSYQPGQVLADIGAAPDGRSAPVDNFGLLWRTQPGLREQLGWATGAAEAVDGAVQGFAGGQMLWTSKRIIYALYTDGTSKSIEDTFVEPTPAH